MCRHAQLLMRSRCVLCTVSESALGKGLQANFLGALVWVGTGGGAAMGTSPVPTHVQSSSLTPLLLCICQRVVALSVATCCPFNRASSSSEKAPWRKWALRRRVGGALDLQRSFSVAPPTFAETRSTKNQILLTLSEKGPRSYPESPPVWPFPAVPT